MTLRLLDVSRRQMNVKPITYEVVGEGCWNCTSHKVHREKWGYYHITQNHKKISIPRYLYALENGPIPEGLVIRHLCNNSWCINPKHLTVGTQADNISDRDRAGNTAKGENHGNALLTNDQVRFIYQSRIPGVRLAEQFSVHKCTVSAIRNRRNYRCVTQGLLRGA